MIRLYSAILAHNEAATDRYLRRVLARCQEFSDAVLVLDDRSTDDTPRIAEAMGCVVRRRQTDTRAWGAESSARQELWSFACEYATQEDDWVLICDADMTLHGDPRPLCQTENLNAWAWPLYDLWDSETTYRADWYWRGHEVPRVWMVAPRRVPEGWVPEWSQRGIHVGHLPENFPVIAQIGPDSVYWLHYSWMQRHHREVKYQQYAGQFAALTPFELAHAQSILDP